ncbi:ATP-binding protein [Candidatus Woesearchaeota archaeon]|nr:ATP-binding protein [Candidatus Woesearchaeota archaeon]
MDELKKWADREEILAVKGPRRSGKTTLLKMLRDWLVSEKGVAEENIIFITFEDLEAREKFSANPKDFINSFIHDPKQKHYFLLDEYHYVKEGGQKLKFLYDTMENVKFVITGSSSMEIAEISKYLVGRVFLFYLFPLNFREFLNAKNSALARIYNEKNSMVRAFLLENKEFEVENDIFVNDLSKHLEDFVTFGGYPDIVKSENIEEKKIVLKNIYETYISRDLEGLLRITYEFKFRKLLSLLSSQTGNMINYNELASSCNSYYKEIMEFLNVLEETYIIKLLRPFHKNLRTELVKNPKVYFIDIGMRNLMINAFTQLDTRVDKGSIMENFVFNELFSIVKDFYKISYWRTLGKAEVDFVLTLGSEIVPCEVKFQPFKKPEIPRSLRSFISAYNPKKAVMFTKNFWGTMDIENTRIKFIPLCYL